MKLLKMSPSSCKLRIPSRANEEPRGKPAIDEPREGRAHAVHVLKNEVPLETWGGVSAVLSKRVGHLSLGRRGTGKKRPFRGSDCVSLLRASLLVRHKAAVVAKPSLWPPFHGDRTEGGKNLRLAKRPSPSSCLEQPPNYFQHPLHQAPDSAASDLFIHDESLSFCFLQRMMDRLAKAINPGGRFRVTIQRCRACRLSGP